MCQVYPREFCYTICEGIAAQKKVDSAKITWNGMMTVEEMDMLSQLGSLDLLNVEQGAEELLHEKDDVAFDDLSGEPLCPKMVRAARA